MKNEKRKRINESRLAIKLFMCLIYLIVITILFVCSYRLFEEKDKIVPWSDVENVEDYTYMTICRMSEKFAYYEEANVGIHFVIEKEDTGQWHTYIIAINENDYDSYKKIIDYSYERTDKEPKPKKVYGYPVIVNEEIKELAIKNIENFVPADNEVKITAENYESYLTNSYLDTTKSKEDRFSNMLFASLLLLFVTFVLLIATIFNKDKIVDKVDNTIDKEIDRARFMFEKQRQKKLKK
ncbi:MAG: hypothetical protein IKF71_02145 [Bacilli bacterium]|nr:hypothetical protein [Bacilli bacterium]